MPIKDPEKRKAAQRRADEKRRARSRGWACILYPESAPEDWRERLAETHVQALVSPLHDSDVTADGEPKKAHYHVLAMFDNAMQESHARAVFAQLGVTAPPELVRSIKAYARYLVHLDDHDKHRYSAADVQAFSGASWAHVALDEEEEKDALLDEIEDFIDEQGLVSYRALCRYARSERPEWVHTIRTKTIHLSAYLKSAVWESRQGMGGCETHGIAD